MRHALSTLILALLATSLHAAGDGGKLLIAGSSTVYPFAKEVAEQLSASQGAPPAEIRSIGTGAGIKAFCGQSAADRPHIANASRRIKQSELAECAKNGVEGVVEVRFGYDGIVLAGAKNGPAFRLDRRDIFLALAKEVPDPSGGQTTIPNPHKNWKEVNPELPDQEILVIGPSPKHGTYDSFQELVMHSGCRRMNLNWISQVQKLGPDALKKVCSTLREDGVYVTGSDDYEKTARQVEETPHALGIFGYSFLNAHSDKLKGAVVDQIEPSFLSISNRIYRMARPLYMYVTKANVEEIPALRQYLAELTSEPAWGENGYLAAKGLVPLPSDERQAGAAAVKELREVQL